MLSFTFKSQSWRMKKQAEAVKEIPNVRTTLTLDPHDALGEFVFRTVAFSVRKLINFFRLSPASMNIYLAYSRKEFNTLVGRKTQHWQVGWANCPKNEMYIFSPLVFEKESIHKKEDFPSVLLHELAHLLTYQLYPFFEPMWLTEGLAYFIAGQGKRDVSIRLPLAGDYLLKIDTTKNWEENVHRGAYQLSFLWVAFLVKEFGKGKLLKLLTEVSFPYDSRKFAQRFKKVYRQDIGTLEKEFRILEERG